MLKKSPILFTLAVFVLAVGWPITPVQAHCAKHGPHSDPNHPHCRNAGGGPTNKASYDVTVTGDLSSDTFVGRDGGGRAKPVLVQFQEIDLGLESFFAEEFDGRGEDCFLGAPVEATPTPLQIRQDKDGFAYVQHNFTGYGDDGITEIPYLLEMLDGFFVGEWRPTTSITTATFTSWEMSISGNNEIACIGTGDFDVFGVMIEVENTTPE